MANSKTPGENIPKKSKGGNIASICYDLALPVTDELGLYLWDVEFVKEGAQWYLRVLIDKEEGISLEDCAAVSRGFDPILDEADPISQTYCLQVSSPGLERKLSRPEHFEIFMGEKVLVKLIRPLDGIREFEGVLSAFDGGTVSIDPIPKKINSKKHVQPEETETKKTMNFDIKDTVSVNVIYDWDRSYDKDQTDNGDFEKDEDEGVMM